MALVQAALQQLAATWTYQPTTQLLLLLLVGGWVLLPAVGRRVVAAACAQLPR